MKVFILFFLVANVNCLHLQLFQSHDYNVFIREFKLSPTEEKTCVTLKESFSRPEDSRNIEVAYSIKTDKCVILYQFADCFKRGQIWRVDKDNPDYPKDANDSSLGSHYQIGSFHVCSQELGGGPMLDVDFYPEEATNGNIMLQYRNVCGCQNIPFRFATDESHIRSVFNHGNGLAVFETEHCEPPYVYVPPGSRVIWNPTRRMFDTSDIFIRVRSFYPMGTVNCARLDASVFKFDFKKDSTHDNTLELENVTTTLESVFINDGPAEITQQYTATQRVKEVLEITRATGFSNVKTIGADVTMENELKFGLPLISNDKIKFKITGKYQWQETSSGTDTEKKSEENEETYSIQETIKIPPCTEYRVNSFVKMVKNYPLEYTAFARLTGKAGEDNMQKNELKLHIGPGMEYVRDIDDHTIEVSVTGEMHAKYGVKTFIDGKGHRIGGCLTKYTSISNKEPVGNFVIERPIR